MKLILIFVALLQAAEKFHYENNDFASKHALGLSTIRQMSTINAIKKTLKDCQAIMTDPFDSFCLTQIFNDDYFWLK